MNLTPLLNKIESEKGLSLKDYKDGTLRRRVEFRMMMEGASSLDDFMNRLDADYHLYWRLLSDLFIGVTDFFRDEGAWGAVRTQVLPDIIERRLSSHLSLPLRVWSAGCSTGEETYSLAIAIKEIYGDIDYNLSPIHVYGTDIMEEKLADAKKGIYSAEKVSKVAVELKEKYLIEIRDPNDDLRTTHDAIRTTQYEVCNELKRLTRFKIFDLARPGIMAGFDLIACRNVLIYFQPVLQEQVIGYFHKALRPGGILWLGMSETLWGGTRTLFEPVFGRERIFRKL